MHRIFIDRFWLMAVVISFFIIAYISPNSSAGGDSYMSLLVSQAILEKGTIQLDDYRAEMPDIFVQNYRTYETADHVYYAYPIGSSLLAVPLVQVFNWLGHDMRLPAEDAWGQNVVSALVVVGVLLLVYGIGRFYLSPAVSLFVAAVCVAGSSMMSTLAAAASSLGVTVLFVLTALWLLLYLERQPTARLAPFALGLVLFGAYFCRPTTAVFIAVTCLYLLWRRRDVFWKTAVTAFVLLLLFSWHAQREYGLLLPPYYLPQQLGGLQGFYEGEATPFPIALYGLLFSPSRGLFVYSPIFLVVVLGVVGNVWRMEKERPLLWLALTWLTLHIIMVARFWNWWGGFSFGPRLLTDMLPALVLLTVLLVHHFLNRVSPRGVWLGTAVFFIAAIVSITIHSYIGLFNRELVMTHGNIIPPHVDKAPELLFDWPYAQFMVSNDRICERNITYYKEILDEGLFILSDYNMGQVVTLPMADDVHKAPARSWHRQTAVAPNTLEPYQIYLPAISRDAPIWAVFSGWSHPGQEWVWTACHTAYITIGPTQSIMAGVYRLQLYAKGNGAQVVEVFLNDVSAGSFKLDSAPTTIEINFAGSLLRSDQPNVFMFTIPGAFPPAGNRDDFRYLGMALQEISIQK
jgi:hypothetical protein